MQHLYFYLSSLELYKCWINLFQDTNYYQWCGISFKALLVHLLLSIKVPGCASKYLRRIQYHRHQLDRFFLFKLGRKTNLRMHIRHLPFTLHLSEDKTKRITSKSKHDTLFKNHHLHNKNDTCIWYWRGTCWANAVGSGHHASLSGTFSKESLKK